jgi:hypothetical protein
MELKVAWVKEHVSLQQTLHQTKGSNEELEELAKMMTKECY